MLAESHGFTEKGTVQTKTAVVLTFLSAVLLCAARCVRLAPSMKQGFERYTLDFETPVDAALQAEVEGIDARLRGKYDMTAEQSAVGVLDLSRLRLAMIHPDRIEYAASVPKIGILLAWFELHPEAARSLDAR